MIKSLTVVVQALSNRQHAMPGSDFPTECFGFVALCTDCFPALNPGADGIRGTEDDKFTQYDMSGWIEGYDPE